MTTDEPTHEHEHQHEHGPGTWHPHIHSHDDGHHPGDPDPRHHEPRFTVAKSPGIGGPPISADEHPFVIREQDYLAPRIIQDYLTMYRQLDSPDPAVIADVEAHLEHCLAWQDEHPSKVKIADR